MTSPQSIYENYLATCPAVYDALTDSEKKLFKRLVRDSLALRNLVIQWQRRYGSEILETDDLLRETRRLKAAMGRIVNHERLPPYGPPLIKEDEGHGPAAARAAQAGPFQAAATSTRPVPEDTRPATTAAGRAAQIRAPQATVNSRRLGLSTSIRDLAVQAQRRGAIQGPDSPSGRAATLNQGGSRGPESSQRGRGRQGGRGAGRGGLLYDQLIS